MTDQDNGPWVAWYRHAGRRGWSRIGWGPTAEAALAGGREFGPRGGADIAVTPAGKVPRRGSGRNKERNRNA